MEEKPVSEEKKKGGSSFWQIYITFMLPFAFCVFSAARSCGDVVTDSYYIVDGSPSKCWHAHAGLRRVEPLFSDGFKLSDSGNLFLDHKGPWRRASRAVLLGVDPATCIDLPLGANATDSGP